LQYDGDVHETVQGIAHGGNPKMGMMKKLVSIYFNRLNEMRSGVSTLLKVFKFKTS